MSDMKGATREARSDKALTNQHMGSVAGPARMTGSYMKQYVGPEGRDACAGGAARIPSCPVLSCSMYSRYVCSSMYGACMCVCRYVRSMQDLYPEQPGR